MKTRPLELAVEPVSTLRLNSNEGFCRISVPRNSKPSGIKLGNEKSFGQCGSMTNVLCIL